MIPVELYSITYHIVIACFLSFLCLRICTVNTRYLENNSINNVYSVVLLTIVILFIGLRDPYAGFKHFGDTAFYTYMYHEMSNPFYSFTKDIGFGYFVKACAYLFPITGFYLLCAILYVVPIFFSYKKWFAEKALFAMAITVASMSFWAFGINTMRNGMAVSFFILALSFFYRKKQIPMLLSLGISISLHYSMMLPLLCLIITHWVRNTKILIIIWCISILIALILGDTTKFLSSIINTESDQRLEIYADDEFKEMVGNIRFRLDFILYSFVPIILGYYYIYKKKFEDQFYRRLLNIYILSNTIWIAFFMFATYTDRFAYLSWFLMPLIMIYPVLKKKDIFKKQYTFIGTLIFLNLLFMLFIIF